MNTQTRSSEIARRAVQTISMSIGGVDPSVIHFLYQEALRLRPPDAILGAAEEDIQDAQEYAES